jgi:transposase InsO family protein
MRIITQDKSLLERIEDLKQKHPFWGYRRIWAYLRYREGFKVNKKKIYRLMKEEKLLVSKDTRLKAKRVKFPYKSKPKPEKPNQIWGIDMTRILIPTVGWVYFHTVLDWFTKKIVGYSLSFTSKAGDWLNGLNSALNNQFPYGIKDTLKSPLYLVSDNGSQPTSLRFMKTCKDLNIKQVFTSYNNPKGNADTERVLRTLKEDLIWIREYHSFEELREDLARWIYNYNAIYPHSALNYKTPLQFEEDYYRLEGKEESLEAQQIFI